MQQLINFDEEIQVLDLSNRLRNYLIKDNKELTEFLIEKDEFDGFVQYRANSAYSEYINALNAGFASPKEIQYQQLFLGIENSYFEYIESMLGDRFYLYYQDIKSKNGAEYNEIITNHVKSCLDVFYEYLGRYYVDVMEYLDRDLYEILNERIPNEEDLCLEEYNEIGDLE